jgi:hypothetical protein
VKRDDGTTSVSQASWSNAKFAAAPLMVRKNQFTAQCSRAWLPDSLAIRLASLLRTRGASLFPTAMISSLPHPAYGTVLCRS